MSIHHSDFFRLAVSTIGFWKTGMGARGLGGLTGEGLQALKPAPQPRADTTAAAKRPAYQFTTSSGPSNERLVAAWLATAWLASKER